MSKTQDQFTNSMFGSYAYGPIIKRNQDHVLVRMNNLIDWSFVEEEVCNAYSKKGQTKKGSEQALPAPQKIALQGRTKIR